MKASELREKSVAELNGELLSQLEAQFKLRMQASTGQLGQPHLLRETRRDIARIKLVLSEKTRAEKADVYMKVDREESANEKAGD